MQWDQPGERQQWRISGWCVPSFPLEPVSVSCCHTAATPRDVTVARLAGLQRRHTAPLCTTAGNKARKPGKFDTQILAQTSLLHDTLPRLIRTVCWVVVAAAAGVWRGGAGPAAAEPRRACRAVVWCAVFSQAPRSPPPPAAAGRMFTAV